jgi:hypothetical protein
MTQLNPQQFNNNDVIEELDCTVAWKIQRAETVNKYEMEIDLNQLFHEQWSKLNLTKRVFSWCGILVQVLTKERHSPILAPLVLKTSINTKLYSIIPLGSCIARLEDPGLIGKNFILSNDVLRYGCKLKIPITLNLDPSQKDKNIIQLSGELHSDIMIYFYGFLKSRSY